MDADSRGLRSLDGALARLTDAETRRDEDAVWTATRDVLAWLYRLEESEQRIDPSYYQHREMEDDGKTLAGLVWVRGLVDHHQAEIRTLVWIEAPVFVKRGGEWRAADVHVRRSGEWATGTVRVRRPVWPPLADLSKQSDRPDKYGRDLHYETFVARQQLSKPLHAARTYLLGRSS